MKCRVCSGGLDHVMTLPDMPSRSQYLTNIHGRDMGIDLLIHQCICCGLVQLTNEPVAYWREAIRSDVSQEMRDFRKKQLEDFKYWWHAGTIIELGRNPKPTGEEYDAFLLLDGLEHVPEPNKLLEAARQFVPESGLGIVEVPNFDLILKKNMVSEFMLDHLTYFTAVTLRRTLSINGFDVMELKTVWHDYILSAVVKKRRKTDFSKMVMDGNPILKFIEGKTAAVWGAGHQAFATLRLLNLDEQKIKYVVDSCVLKQGRYTPITNIPIVPPQTLKEHPVEALIIMCGSYSKEVEKQAKDYEIPNVMVL